MTTYTAKLKAKRGVAEGTIAFHFEKPLGFEFIAGQFLELTLINPSETDAEGDNRAFSISSAPHEADLAITTRMRDTAFKRVLKAMPLNTEVTIEGPFGSFTLHKDTSKPAVFIAGGIGVTPFLSMSRDAAEKKLPHEIYLFYSNRRPQDAAYLAELKELEKRNPQFHLIATMTEGDDSEIAWQGRHGRIDDAILCEYIPDPARSIFYLAGPPAMVTAMRELVVKISASEDNIRAEEFPGYATAKAAASIERQHVA